MMRFQVFSVCTLAAIATGNSIQPARATPQEVAVVGGEAVAQAVSGEQGISGGTDAPQMVAQSTAADATEPMERQQTAQYYQQYQSTVVVPVQPVESRPPATAVSPGILPSPGESTPPASLAEPIWVVPTRPATPDSVTMPNLPAQVPAQATVQPPLPIPGGDVAVLATDVLVVGVEAELQQVVRDRIRTRAGGQTSQSQLQQDVAQILDTGLFATARVTSRPNPDGITVIFQVTPMVVRSLRLSGAEALTLETANSIFQPLFGTPVSPPALNRAVQRINQWYRQNGYTLARVLNLQPTREGVITIEVAEGVVGDVQVRFVNREGRTVDEKGNPIRVRTQPGFARRQIQLQPGQVFREELARQDLQRLLKLGIFETATVRFEGDARQTTVIYNLVERSPRALNFGGGYNDDIGIYGAVSFQDVNFGGLGQRLGTNVQVGTRDIQGELRFSSPYRDTDPATPGYGANLFRRSGVSRVFDEEIRLANDDRVRERRIGGGINLDRPLGPTWMGSVGINYSNISMRDRDGDIFVTDVLGNPLSFSGTGIDDLTTVSFSASQDLRDNPINPGDGSLLNLSTEQSIPLGRGEILGNRLQANYSRYIPVEVFQVARPEHPQVLAFNVQAGTVFGDLPPYNAFVLGGPNSVRGYGTGDVASSRSYLQATAEYRFPIYRFVGGAVFADFGTDLGTSGNVLGEPGVQRGKPGSGFGFGAGVRVNSPIGIVRVDLGFSDQGDTRVQFGFGQKF
jgi:outer membrane protein insertion porin family